ncbi:MAG: hypothetical protein H0U75_12980 [Legionella sp.]|nr:hypothetical protein [Legionella sp.]
MSIYSPIISIQCQNETFINNNELIKSNEVSNDNCQSNRKCTTSTKNANPEHKSSYHASGPCFTLKVAPKHKALIAFLFNLASRRTGEHYSAIDTGINSDPFSYKLHGVEDEVQLLLNDKWFRTGRTLSDYFSLLIPSIHKILKKISEGWVETQRPEWASKDLYFNNSKISGTYYVFLLQQIAINMGIDVNEGYFPGSNSINFDTWWHDGGWNLSDHIALKGRPDLVTRFIALLPHELSLSSGKEILKAEAVLNVSNSVFLDKAKLKVTSPEGSAALNVSSSVFVNTAKLTVTSGYRRMTFVQELNEQNQQNAASSAVDSLRSTLVEPNDTNSENQRPGAPGGPIFF